MIKTIIFDYDGTIHQTLGIYEPAFRETYQWLTEQKVAEEQKIASSKIAGWLGLNSKEMWDTFMPELDQKYKDHASKMAVSYTHLREPELRLLFIWSFRKKKKNRT